MTIEFKNGFSMGQEHFNEKRFSTDALGILDANLSPGDLSWLDTENGELRETIQNLQSDLGGLLSDEFVNGYWRGVRDGILKKTDAAVKLDVLGTLNGGKL